MIKNDWLLEQIKTLTRSISLLLLGKYPKEEEMVLYKKENRLWLELDAFLKERRVNDGENRLFEALDNQEEGAYVAVVLFYDTLNQWTEEELKEAEFSREEIYSGLKDAMKIYGPTGELFV